MPKYKNRSSSVDSVFPEQPCSWFKNVFRGSKHNRHHKRNKSEKSVHSQTENNSLLSNNDSGVQCSEHFLKTETTRSTLLESYINDISEKSLTKSDILVIENQRKKLLNPMKIFNQILQDVMSHFPEIELSLKALTMGLIDEYCIGFVKLQTVYLKQMIPKENRNFQQESRNFFQDVRSKTETIISPSTYDREIENIMETISICGNDYKCNNFLLNNFSQGDETFNRRFHRRIRKRYVVKKSKISKEKATQHTKQDTDEVIQTDNNMQFEESLFVPYTSDDTNLNYLNDSLKNLIQDEATKESSNNKQCTISISPFNIMSIYGDHHHRTLPESLTGKNTDLISQKTSCNPDILSMARGDEQDRSCENLKCFSSSEKCEKDRKKYIKYSRNMETLSLNLDYEIFPGSSEYQADFERTISSSVSIDTDEETFHTEIGHSDNPAEVSVIYSTDSSPRPALMGFRNFVDISNSNNHFRSPTRLNMFCESLYEKFNLKASDNNVCQCDTELSVSTKLSRVPDQTVSMSNIMSDRSDTVCEVLTDKCVRDSPNTKPVKSRFSVKFIENISKEINRKHQFNSSFRKHTIASKMKIKNQDSVHCRKRESN